LEWRKSVKEEDFAGYHIYRTTRNDSDFSRVTSRLVSADSLGVWTEIPVFGTYFFAVSSVDRSGNERPAAPVFVEVWDNEPPAAPRGVTASGDSARVTLRWRKPGENDVSGYLVYRTVNADHAGTY